MVTSIQISEGLKKELINRKIVENETYEEVIWGLVEDVHELSSETKRDIARARAEIRGGRSHTLAEVKKELDL